MYDGHWECFYGGFFAEVYSYVCSYEDVDVYNGDYVDICVEVSSYVYFTSIHRFMMGARRDFV